MKKLVLMIVLVMSTTVNAASEKIIESHDFLFIQNGKPRRITVEQKEVPGDEYLLIITDHGIYRIHPCGQLERQDWKELSPNGDTAPIAISISGWTYSGN